LPGGPRPLRVLLPLGHGRRVPGHQPRPVPLAPAPHRGAPKSGRRGRRCPVPARGNAGPHGDGSVQPTEAVREGDEDLSCCSSWGGKNQLPFTPAWAVRPGMAMFTEDGEFDVVESVERVRIDAPVYDLNVEDTHNFVAEGLVTHSSVYGFRGADIRNILDFQD